MADTVINSVTSDLVNLSILTADQTGNNNRLIISGTAIELVEASSSFGDTMHGVNVLANHEDHGAIQGFGSRRFVSQGAESSDADILSGAQTFDQIVNGGFTDVSYEAVSVSECDQSANPLNDTQQIFYLNAVPAALNFLPVLGGLMTLQILTATNSINTPAGWAEQGAVKSLGIVSQYQFFTKIADSADVAAGSVTISLTGNGQGRGIARVRAYKPSATSSVINPDNQRQGQRLNTVTLSANASITVNKLSQPAALSLSGFVSPAQLISQKLSNAKSLGVPPLAQKSALITEQLKQLSLLASPNLVAESEILAAKLSSGNALLESNLTQKSNFATDKIAQNSTLSEANNNQNSRLSIDKLSQDETLTAPNVGQKSALQPENSTVNQSLSNPQLSVDGVLTALGLGQNTALSSPAIEQDSIMSVGGLKSGSFLDLVASDISFKLTISKLRNESALGQLTLAQINKIVPDKLAAVQLIKRAQLSTINKITPENTAQAESLSSAIIAEQATALIVNNLGQLNAIDPVTFLQQNRIDPSSLTQQQVIDLVRFGGVVVGYFEGEISVFSAFNGNIVVNKSLSGDTKIVSSFNSDIAVNKSLSSNAKITSSFSI